MLGESDKSSNQFTKSKQTVFLCHEFVTVMKSVTMSETDAFSIKSETSTL